MKVRTILYLLAVFDFCCNESDKAFLYRDGYKVVGDISGDAIYNGTIKLYDSASGILYQEVEYKNGIRNGMQITYYKNERIFSKINYENGKVVGLNEYYDSIGYLTDKEYFYYDIEVGPEIKYVADKPIEYQFYTFDDSLIYSLDYSQLKNYRIIDISRSFFHFLKYDSVGYFSRFQTSSEPEYLLYLINPPHYNFDYDLVLIDSSYKVIKVIDKLQTDLPFCSFSIPTSFEKHYTYAVRLQVTDSLNNKADYLMFKKLNE